VTERIAIRNMDAYADLLTRVEHTRAGIGVNSGDPMDDQEWQLRDNYNSITKCAVGWSGWEQCSGN
jgi:hypothetical protein